VSLKMYMGLGQAQVWIAGFADLVRREMRLDLDLFVVPDFLSLQFARDTLAATPIWLGAQDLFWEDAGPFTGEISAPMLVEAGCNLVEIGHSERRQIFGETDEIVARKVEAAVRSKLTPILCVGEVERSSPQSASRFCLRQLESATSGIGVEAPLIVAYEPVWAVGASEPASAKHIVEVANGLNCWISQRSETRLIYGGSAKPGLFSQLNGAVDGLFLGRFAHDLQALCTVLREADLRV